MPIIKRVLTKSKFLAGKLKAQELKSKYKQIKRADRNKR